MRENAKAKILLLVGATALVVGVLAVGWIARAKPEEKKTQQTAVLQVSEPPKQPEATLEVFAVPVWVILPAQAGKIEGVHGQTIAVGAKVLTGAGGRAQIIYPNKTVTRLDENTEIVLKEFTVSPQKVSVKIEKNRVWSRVSKLLGQETYQTQTNTVVATVRGTSYGHGILSDGGNQISSTKGTIDSNCHNNTQDALVVANNKVVLNCKAGETAKTGKIVTKDKDEWFNFNNNEDEKLDERFGKNTYDDEEGVLGVTTDEGSDLATLILTPTPTLIDCLGADGKISRVTKEVCDSVKSYWDAHPPPPPPAPPAVTTTSTSTTTIASPTATPTPSPTPTSFFALVAPSMFPTPTPTPVAEPDITNLVSSPSTLDGSLGACSVTLAADIFDTDGVSSAIAVWEIFDSSGAPAGTGETSMILDVNSSTWFGTQSLSVPASGRVVWHVIATDTLGNSNTSTNGPDVAETSGTACSILF